MEVWGRRMSRADLLARLGRVEQAAGVRMVVLADGPGRGVRILEFATASGLTFDVVVDRGFDLGRCSYRGIPLAWISPVGVVGPWYRELQGLGFLRTFGGGFMTTAGLDHTIFATEDTAEHFNYPPKPTESYPLHGRLSTLPARVIGCGERWDGDSCVLWAEAEVEQAAVFGEHLVLRRRIEVGADSLRIVISDVVENRGYAPTPHMLLYHVNVGYPVVDEGSAMVGAVASVTPRGDHPVAGYDLFTAPRPEFVEEVFEQTLRPDDEGLASVAIVNPRLQLGVYQRWQLDRLPYHFVWRMLGVRHYVVGLEPSTNRADGRLAARSRGELLILQPGQSRDYELELGVLPDEGAVDAFAERSRMAASNDLARRG